MAIISVVSSISTIPTTKSIQAHAHTQHESCSLRRFDGLYNEDPSFPTHLAQSAESLLRSVHYNVVLSQDSVSLQKTFGSCEIAESCESES